MKNSSHFRVINESMQKISSLSRSFNQVISIDCKVLFAVTRRFGMIHCLFIFFLLFQYIPVYTQNGKLDNRFKYFTLSGDNFLNITTGQGKAKKLLVTSAYGRWFTKPDDAYAWLYFYCKDEVGNNGHIELVWSNTAKEQIIRYTTYIRSSTLP